MTKKLAFAAAALLAAGTVGCSKPDCNKAVDHTYKILGEDAAKMPADQKAALEAALPKQKAEALEECKAGKPRPLTKEREKCIMAAKTKAELEKCAM